MAHIKPNKDSKKSQSSLAKSYSTEGKKDKSNPNNKKWLFIGLGVALLGVCAISIVAGGGFLWSQMQDSSTQSPISTKVPVSEIESLGEDNIEATPTLSLFTTQPPPPTAPPSQPIAPQAILFEDNFDDPNSGWDITHDDEGFTDYVNGEYVIRVEPDKYIRWANPLLSFEVVAIDVIVRLSDGTKDNALGIICAYEDIDNFKVGVVSSDGYFGFQEYINGEFEYIQNDSLQTSSALPTDGQTMKITLECVEDRMTLFVNGTFIGEVKGVNLPAGDVGLWAETFESGFTELAFDDFMVRNLLIQPNN